MTGRDPGWEEPSRVVIVGAGQTGSEVARQLGPDRRVVVLDLEPAKLERLEEGWTGKPLRTLARDGTCALALRDAGAEGADWVIATTDRDDVNAEICRVAGELNPRPSTLGTVRAEERGAGLRETGATSIARPVVIATQIRNRVEHSHQVATTLGLGLGEIREIQVLPTSPAIGVRLRDLGARKWLVAGIYRSGTFVVPDGAATIEAGDRLLITGDPEVAPGAAEFLREGKSLFPLQFGSDLVVYADRRLPSIVWREAGYLFRSSRAKRCRVVAAPGVAPPDGFAVPDDELDVVPLGRNPVEDTGSEAGCVVFPRQEPSLFARLGLNTSRSLATMAGFPCPVLLPGGRFPWERVVLPVTDLESTLRAADTALGLARQFDIPFAILSVRPPSFISREPEDHDEVLVATIERMGRLYRTRVPVIEGVGNVPRQVATMTEPGDLVVLGYDIRRGGSFFRPDRALHTIIRVRASVLALPLHAARR